MVLAQFFFGMDKEFTLLPIQTIQQSAEIQVFFWLYCKSGSYFPLTILIVFVFFWNFSLLPGNIYIYLTLKTDTIDRAMRYSLFSVLAVVVAVSLALFVLLIWRSCTEQRENSVIRNNETKKSSLARIVQTLKISGQLLKTRNMLLLLIIFAYLGKYRFNFSGYILRKLCSRFITSVFRRSL